MARGGSLSSIVANAGFAVSKPALAPTKLSVAAPALDEDAAEARDVAAELTSGVTAVKASGALATLLANPIVFVESKAAGAHLQAAAKYEPCNVGPPKTSPARAPPLPDEPPDQPVASTSKAPIAPAAPSRPVSLRWPSSRQRDIGPGFNNAGNTCYANATLQALVHTPAFATALLEDGMHDFGGCKLRQKGFCALCNMRELMQRCWGQRDSSFMPSGIVNNLRKLAAHFRPGRQEDSHEFLRFLVDAMQNACLSSMGLTPKSKAELRRQTAIHRIFGGRFRSRVTCMSCHANSDTYDDFLDLSLEVTQRTDSLKDCFNAFRRVDYLRGKNKYKCESCKREVDAEKAFSIESAPPVLTIHLKRFTPLGGKCSADVKYPEHVSLRDLVSDDDEAPVYTLHAVVCHSGSGPHSGHYYSFVRNAHDQWFRMDDNSVSRQNGGFKAAQLRSAYVLLYTQQRDSLDAAIHAGLSTSSGPAKSAKPLNGQFRQPLVNGMNGKRKHEDEDDGGSPAKRFIGPQRPGSSLGSLGSALPNASSSPPPRLPHTSPQQHFHTSSSRAPSSDDLHHKYGVPSAVKSANFYGGPQRSHQPAPYHQPQHRHGGAQYGRQYQQRGRGGGPHGRGRGGGWQSGGGGRRY